LVGRERLQGVYSVEKLAARSPTRDSAKFDLLDRSKIDDRDAVKGQRTPAKGVAKVLAEFSTELVGSASCYY